MFVLTQLINSTLKINHIFKKSNPHFINWMAGSISNFTHIDTGVLNGVVTTVYNCHTNFFVETMNILIVYELFNMPYYLERSSLFWSILSYRDKIDLV